MADATARPTSREYLEQLRARRSARVSDPPQAAVPPTAPTPVIHQPTPVAEPAVMPPQPSQMIDPQTMSTQPLASPPPEPVTIATPPMQTQSPPPAPPTSSSSYTPPITNQNESVLENDPTVVNNQFKPIPEMDIYEWTAPSRVFKKRNRQFYITVGLITFLISLILFFAGQFLPIAVVISVAFLGYVLSSVPPETIKNKFTTHGIHSDNAMYYWDEMGNFWSEEKYGQEYVTIEIGRFPGRLTLLVGSGDRNIVKGLLSEMLLEQRPIDTFFDKAAKWLQDKIPLEV